MSNQSRKGEKRRQWDQENMDMALAEVRSKSKTASEAAKYYKIPRKTLTDRISKNIKDDCKAGDAGTYLSDEHELSLCSYIEYMAKRGFPLTISQVMMYAWVIDKTKGKNKFGEKGPCYGWWLGFKARHPESAKLRKPDSLDRGRALFSTVDNLRTYFQLLKSVLDEGDFWTRPQDVYNCDETVVDLNKSAQKVVVPRRFRTSHSRQVASSEHVTIHCCVSAAGNTVPPFIIYKAAFPGGNYTAGGPDGALYGKQKTGFMDSELFVKWFKKLFIPHARPTEDRSVLLLVDGHSSHCSPEVIQTARENNVILLALAPHTTHLCQPLDVAVYRSFKIQLSKTVKIGQALRGDLWISKSNVARIIKQPFEASMTIQNIKAGFRKCGIFPYNPNAIDKTQLFRNKLIPSEDVDLSLPPTTNVNNDDQGNGAVDPVGVSGEDGDHAIVQDEINNHASAMNVQLETGDLLQSSDGPVIILEDLNIMVDPSNLPSSSSAPIENSLPEEGRNDVSDISLDVNGILPDLSISEDILQSVISDISNNNHQIESTALTLTDTSNSFKAKDTSHVQPDQQIKFHMFSKLARLDNTFHVGDTIKVVSTTVDVGVQTEDEATGYRSLPRANPLITAGIISEDLAEIFTPPDEKIPVGRKRPLRAKSTARVMTGADVIEDLENQQREIDRRNERREATAQRNVRRRGRGNRRQNPRNGGGDIDGDQPEPSTSVRTMQVRRTSIRSANRRTRNVGNEDDNVCFVCNVNFYRESKVNKDKWVGCDGNECPHWVCPRQSVNFGQSYRDIR